MADEPLLPPRENGEPVPGTNKDDPDEPTRGKEAPGFVFAAASVVGSTMDPDAPSVFVEGGLSAKLDCDVEAPGFSAPPEASFSADATNLAAAAGAAEEGDAEATAGAADEAGAAGAPVAPNDEKEPEGADGPLCAGAEAELPKAPKDKLLLLCTAPEEAMAAVATAGTAVADAPKLPNALGSSLAVVRGPKGDADADGAEDAASAKAADDASGLAAAVPNAPKLEAAAEVDEGAVDPPKALNEGRDGPEAAEAGAAGAESNPLPMAA